jgi:hypothetical protein
MLGGLVALSPWACLAADAPAATAAAAPADGATKVHLIFVNDDLRTPGLTTPERDATLVDYKYYDITRQIVERAPLVFEANALAGKVSIVDPPTPESPLVLDDPADAAVITLRPVTFSKRQQLLKTWASVSFDVASIERPPSTAPTGKVVKQQLGITLGPDPVLGILRINRLDASLVDWLLTATLDIAASRGVLVLPQAKAVRPRA